MTTTPDKDNPLVLRMDNTSARTIVLHVEMFGPQKELEDAYSYISSQGIYSLVRFPVEHTLCTDSIDDYTEYDSLIGEVTSGGGVFRLGLYLRSEVDDVTIEDACNITYALLRDYCNEHPRYSSVVDSIRANVTGGGLAHWDYYWKAPYEPYAWSKCVKILRTY
jgi:hypothetical protein